MSKLSIQNWAFINNNKAALNGEDQLIFNEAITAEQKLEQLYRSLNVAYPKFFKMDTQSKLGWLCAEYTLQSGQLLEGHALKEVALVLSNQKSSLDTDEQYQSSLDNSEEFLPSPAVFVYTLANIVAGEICIRHGIKGENNFFISEEFDAAGLFNYVTILFEEALCTQCLVGWVEAYRGDLRSVFALVHAAATTKEEDQFTIERLNQLYQTSKS